ARSPPRRTSGQSRAPAGSQLFAGKAHSCPWRKTSIKRRKMSIRPTGAAHNVAMRYSFACLLANRGNGNRSGKPLWREPEPKPSYDVVIVGGGGHGLATAHYLAKETEITNVARGERSHLGHGKVR